MPCASLTQNLNDSCVSSTGGIKSIFVSELDSTDTLTISGGTVTALELTTGKQFFEYNFRKQTGTFTETITVSEETGSVFYAPEVNIVLSKMEISKRNEIKLLAVNDLQIIVLDNNGTYWLVGSQNGMSISAGTSATGTNYGDLNGYNLTFGGGEPEPMLQIPSALIPDLLIPA